MNGTRSEIIVGLFAIVVLVILSLMTFRIGNYTIGKGSGYLVYARFNNTAGLSEKTRVKIAGVNAGMVESITLDEGVAVVEMLINKDVRLYSNARAYIRTTGLLGDKFVEINIGDELPYIEDGGKIRLVSGMADIDDMVINFTELLEKMDEVMVDVGKALKANTASLTNTIANVEELSDVLKSEAPGMLEDLHSAVERLDHLLAETSPSLVSIAHNADEATDRINLLTRKINEGEGTLGKLIHDDELYYSMNAAASSVSNTLAPFHDMKTTVSFKGDYMFEHEDSRTEFSIEFAPDNELSYVFGVVSDPVGRYTTSGGTTTITEQAEFTAQTVNWINRDTRLRIGLFESTLGVGLDRYMMDGRIKAYLDVWDFSAIEYLSSQPHLRLGLDMFATRNIFFTGGVDNPLNDGNAGFYLGGGTRFIY